MPRLAPAMVSWLKTRVHMDKIVVTAVMRMGAHTGLACDEQRFPLLKARNAQLIDVVHEHDAIVDHGAHEDQEANEAHDGQLLVADEQADEAAGEGQGDGEEDDEGAQEALELATMTR